MQRQPISRAKIILITIQAISSIRNLLSAAAVTLLGKSIGTPTQTSDLYEKLTGDSPIDLVRYRGYCYRSFGLIIRR